MPAFTIGDITVGGGRPFVLMAGPCVIESEAHATTLATELAQLTGRLGVPFEVREQIAALVRWHHAPFFLIDRTDAERLAITISQT